MRIAEVVGRLTLSRCHPALKNSRYIVALPMSKESLINDAPATGEDVVAVDQIGASPGALIGLSESAEAANPFRPAKVPVDAYCACLIDRISLGKRGQR